jgi:hypothetical protein
MKFDLDYYKVSLYVKLDIHEDTKTVCIRDIFCKSTNFWKELTWKASPNTGSGGLEWYNTNKKYIGRGSNSGWDRDSCNGSSNNDCFSIEFAIEKFFGPTWTVKFPLTARRISDDYIQLAKDYRAMFAFYKCGPWSKTTGLFVVE